MLTTIQDLGRVGNANLGITSGGPADKAAFNWANRLLNNDVNSSVLEINFGGLKLIANCNTTIAITGAQVDCKINNLQISNWQSHKVSKGDTLEIGYASNGCRAYLAVSGGFKAIPQFGSTSTVLREKLGGYDGEPLKQGQQLDIATPQIINLYKVKSAHIPTFSNCVTLRVVTGYQIDLFNQQQVNKFFASEYKVSSQYDRMGYRLEGPQVKSNITSMYSEGITLGAIQIPPDGQPIILCQDRQTIGGYPKIGSVLSIDLDRLMQCTQGAKIHFEPISIHCAHNLLHLAKHKYDNASLIAIDS